MARIEVTITQDDIERAIAEGHRASIDKCPAAIEVRKSYPDAVVLCSFWEPIKWGPACLMTPEASAWVTAFTVGEPVEPTTLIFEVSDAVLETL